MKKAAKHCTLREHPPGTVFQAQELYTVQRLSLHQIAAELGVHRSTLTRWNKHYGWGQLREEVARSRADGARQFDLALGKMLDKLKDSLDPQDAYAVASLESIRLKKEEFLRKYAPKPEQENTAHGCDTVSAVNDEERIDLLEKAVNQRIASLLAGGTTPEAVRDVGQMLGTIKQLRQDFEAKRETNIAWEE